jgi:hypothetical protein
MSLTLEQVNRKLTEWLNDRKALHTNILELQSQTEYQLAADGSQFKGSTYQRFISAKQAEDRLISDMESFDQHLQKIAHKQSQVGIINRGKDLDELTELIEGTSVALPAETVELSSRQLFDKTERLTFISPQHLRQRMQKDFAELRDFFSQLSKAWLAFGEQSELAKAQLTKLKQSLRTCGKDSCPEVVALEARLISTTKRWKSNPFEITANLQEDLRPYFAQINQQIVSIEQEQNLVEARVHKAAQQLELLLQLRVSALQSHASCSNLIDSSDAINAAKAPPSLKVLRESLSKLQALYQEGHKAEAKISLESWLLDYQKLWSETNRALEFNLTLQRKLDDLKTRFALAKQSCLNMAQQELNVPRSVVQFKESAIQILESGKIDLAKLDLMVYSMEVKLGELNAARQKSN